MSTVLWANILVNGQVVTDDSDKVALYKHADKLDALSRRLGLGSFLEACDTTDLRFNTSDLELPAGAQTSNEVMAAQGVWLDAPQATRLLDGLLAHLRLHEVRFGLLTNDYLQVLSELSAALAYAHVALAHKSKTKFNFCVVA